jgi:hypothetical protein
MTYTLTVYAADIRTPLASGGRSIVGHMYYGLTNNLTGEKALKGKPL